MLQPFEVSAVRWQHGNSVSPGQMSVITSSDIAFNNPQTSADMLQSAGNVFIQKSQLGGGSPMIRGFAANRILIVVDGIRMNNAIFRSGNLQNVISMDPFSVEHAEVIFGPGSVAFGSDAIGGVMSFTTFEPGFSPDDKLKVNGKVLTRWSSANNEKTGQLKLNIGTRHWSFLTIAGVSDFGDLRTGSRGPDEYLRPHYIEGIDGKDSMFVNPDPQIQKFSGYSAQNIMQKIRFKPNEKLDMNYTFLYNTTSDFPRYDRLTEYSNGVLRNAEWYYGPQKWMLHSLNIVHSGNNTIYDKAVFNVAFQNFEESRNDRKFNNAWLRTQKETVSVLTTNFDFSRKIKEKGTLLYGLETMFNTVGSESSRLNINSEVTEPLGTRYPDGATWNTFAAYTMYTYKLNEHFNIPLGIRYSHIISKATFDTTFYPFSFTEATLNTGAVNGSAGLIYRPDNNWQFTMNLTTGFRAPNIDDMGKVFESEPGSVVVPNPDLRPEYAYSAEGGITRIIGNTVRIDISGFYTLLQDALVRRDFLLNGADSIVYDGDMSRVQSIQNAAFANVYGLSANFEVKLPAGFGISGTFNWQKGEEELDNGTKAPLRHVAPIFGMGKIQYSRKNLKTEFSVMYNGRITNDRLAPSEQEKPYMYALDENGNPWVPSWHTMNFRVGWSATSWLHLNAGVENILDVRYRTYSSGISAQGRNVVVSAILTY